MVGLTLLSACASETVVYEPVCIPMVEYDQAQRDALADEIDAASAETFWPDFVVDALTLRARLRAVCEGDERSF